MIAGDHLAEEAHRALLLPLGMTVVICWPTISSAGRPNMRSAPAFQLVRRRSSEALVIASLEDSTIAARRARVSSASLRSVMSTRNPWTQRASPPRPARGSSRPAPRRSDRRLRCSDTRSGGAPHLAEAFGVREDSVEVVRVHGIVQEGRPLDPLVGRVAEQGLDLRADVDVPHGLVCRADVGHQRKVLDQRAVAELRLAQRGLRAPALLQLLLRRAVQARALERERGEVCESGEQRDLRSAEGLARAVVREPEHPDDIGARSQRHADHAMKPVRFEARQAPVRRVVVDRERF